MLECLIVGDSIAVGVSHVRPECVSYSVGGWNSWQWNKKFKDKMPLEAKDVIISLGSNDHEYVKTEKELRVLRENTNAKRVFWVLPAIKPDIQNIVVKVAMEYGDVILPIKHLQKDGIHPSDRGYKDLASKTKQ